MVHRDQDHRPKRSALGNIVQALVERFFAWIGRYRRLAKDFEATIGSARAFLYAASVMLLVRRIARAS
jgi:transposase